MTGRLRAAVIGLGQAGWRFDEEPGREAVWTHAGAYGALVDDFDLVGACDPSAAARAAFSGRHGSIRVFEDIATMMREVEPDVVSICTPNATHRAVLEDVLANGRPRTIWCEKPLATSPGDGQAIVAACASAGAYLVVSHVRRWSPLWQRFKVRLENEPGVLRCLRIAMPNRLWSIGSHAVDLLVWLGGPVEQIAALPVDALTEDGEAAVAAVMTLQSGASCILQTTGKKAGLIVEAEAIGDRGRLSLREDRMQITFEPFETSTRYDGYAELAGTATEALEMEPGFSPFVAIAQEVARLARGQQKIPTCDGASALEVQQILEALAGAAAGAVGARQATI